MFFCQAPPLKISGYAPAYHCIQQYCNSVYGILMELAILTDFNIDFFVYVWKFFFMLFFMWIERTTIGFWHTK